MKKAWIERKDGLTIFHGKFIFTNTVYFYHLYKYFVNLKLWRALSGNLQKNDFVRPLVFIHIYVAYEWKILVSTMLVLHRSSELVNLLIMVNVLNDLEFFHLLYPYFQTNCSSYYYSMLTQVVTSLERIYAKIESLHYVVMYTRWGETRKKVCNNLFRMRWD